jgi:TonB-linked SusC/RagA family outer membrane protein
MEQRLLDPRLRRFISVVFLCMAINFHLFAAKVHYDDLTFLQTNVITGKVTTAERDPLPGVTVVLKGTLVTSETDAMGVYSIEVTGTGDVLVFKLPDYTTLESVVYGQSVMDVVLVPIKHDYLIYGKQDSRYTTAAISTISGESVRYIGGFNRNNVLGGRIPGLTVNQSNGEPGNESSSVYIRGLRTLGGASQTPYILVDGYVRADAEFLNPNDIESITLLKDAAATAIYGLRGSNGVLLITTKRGSLEPTRVSLDISSGIHTPTRLPKYLGSYDYAYLYNEASRNEGGLDRYDAATLEAYRTNSNPFTHPNVDWLNEFLKDQSFQQNYNLSIRGGERFLRYFASAGYVKNNGLFNVDEDANTYNTNANFDMIMLRSNVDVQATRRLTVSMDMTGRQQKRNYPGDFDGSVNRILETLYELPPNVFPIFNEDGSVSGNSQYTNNPYGLLNLSGYSYRQIRTTDATLKAKHDLDFIVPGLVFNGAVSFDSYFNQTIRRHKGFVVYEGSLATERGVKNPAQQQNAQAVDGNQRVFDMRFGLDYDKIFENNKFSGKLFWNHNSFEGDRATMPRTYRGVMGMANYVYNDRYIADVSFAYQGSEQTSDEKRYIFYPAVSLGWILSEESFLQKQSINFLKLRASHGLTGNDSGIGYFQKMTFFTRAGTGYLVGDNLAAFPGYREGAYGNYLIAPEKTRKSNAGIDGLFFNNRFTLSANAFYEKTSDIIVPLNRVARILGAPNVPEGNGGIVENKGVEAALGYQNLSGAFKYNITGNFSYAKNKIIDMQEQDYPFLHNYRTGYPIGSQFGLQYLGFFYDDNEISSSPTQTYGAVRPGDLKYKDITGDNKVDIDDIAYIGKSWMPEMVFGLNVGLAYKGFDFNAFGQGINNVNKRLTNYAFYEFYPNNSGKVMEHHLDRWAYYPELGIDTRATATYPRLSLQGNNTNNRLPASTFNLKDASYFRLKSVEFGYTLPANVAQSISLSKLRIYASGYNMLTFDKIKVIDPELSGGGTGFPIQRIVNLGINVQF